MEFEENENVGDFNWILNWSASWAGVAPPSDRISGKNEIEISIARNSSRFVTEFRSPELIPAIKLYGEEIEIIKTRDEEIFNESEVELINES